MGWNVTFYYQQELRSAYMNNLLKGMIKPGVYNMDCALYTEKIPDDVPRSGVYLSINPGTMFIFSNCYDTSTGSYIRDFSKTGSYLIKCVYEGDGPYTVTIADFSGQRASDMFLEDPDVPGKPLLPEAFVTAWLNYDPEATTTATPTFQLCAPSNNPITSENTNYLIPNEDMLTSSNLADSDISYLLVGTILYNGKYNAPFAEGGSLVGGWVTSGGREGQSEWIKSHVFTARGLPDYKGSASKSFSALMPNIIFAKNYRNWFFTSGQFYFNSILHDIAGTDWKAIYGQRGNEPALNSTSGCGIDKVYTTRLDGSYTSSPLVLSSLAGKTILDFFFLTTKSEYSRAISSIAGLLNDSKFSLSKRILPYRVVVETPGGQNLNTSTLGESYGLASTDATIIPLDTSISNVNRLKSFVLSRDIILPVIDRMRQDATLTPFLDPSLGESLIPIAIAFRQVNATGDGFTDHQTINSATYFGGEPVCNPANILSYFDLQNSAFAILGNSLAAQEVFDTLPFVD